MPGPSAIFTLGAVGAAGAAVYVNRRSSMSSDTDIPTPIALARRRSSTTKHDPEWSHRKQPELLWRRDNGVSFSHSSKPKYPTNTNSTAALGQSVGK